MSKVMLTLPWPPSVNRYWRNVKGRVLVSKEGRDYRKKVCNQSLLHRFPRLGKARLRMSITAFPPDRRRRDLDNILKAVLDALQAAGVYHDDSQIDELSITRASDLKGALSVTVEAL
jgi:crossover junction endodeoxyribonuclease RusA